MADSVEPGARGTARGQGTYRIVGRRIAQALGLLSHPYRGWMVGSVLGSLVIAGLDMLGVAATLPLMQLVAGGDLESGFAAVLARWLGITDTATVIVAMAAVVAGAFLVAPSDVEAATYPADLNCWAPIPLQPLPFPSVVVASANDPFASLDRTGAFAGAWGSRLVEIGDAGHVNADSGYGEWPEGERLLDEFCRDLNP